MNTDEEIEAQIKQSFGTIFKDREDLHFMYKKRIKDIIIDFLEDFSEETEEGLGDLEEYITNWIESRFRIEV